MFVEPPAGSDLSGTKLEEVVSARVDPRTGETSCQPDLPAPNDPALLAWLESDRNLGCHIGVLSR